MPANEVRCVAHARMRGRAELERAAASLGVPVVWTRRAGDVERLARRALDEGVPTVAVAGGDGSVHEAANALHGTSAALAVVPGGTGNDFARALDIPEDPGEALRIAISGKTRTIDAARIEYRRRGKRRERVFVNIAEAGFGATAVARMDRLGRLAGRTLAYPLGILSALAAYRPKPVRVRLDDREWTVPRMTNLVVANGQYFGRGLRPAPDAKLDDGLLDVLLLENFSHGDIATKVAKLKNGPPPGMPGMRTFRAERVEVDGPESVLVEADGEVLGNIPMRVVVMKQALRVKTRGRVDILMEEQ